MKEKHYAVTKSGDLVEIEPFKELPESQHNFAGYLHKGHKALYLKKDVVAYTITIKSWKNEDTKP